MIKKNILLITVRSDIGGGSKHVNSIFENLQNDFNIFIASPKDEPYGTRWAEKLNNNFFELPHRKFSLFYLFRLIKFVKKNNIKVIHAHGKGAGIYARLIKIFLPSVKIIFTWHGFHIETYNRFLKSFYVLVEKILSHFTDLFINVSEGEQKVCVENKIYNPDKSVIIYNGLKDEYKNPDKNLLRTKLGLPQDKFIILNISRFDKTKNVSAFIETAIVLKDEKEIFFVLAGDGEEKNKVISIIEKHNLKNILLTGFISNPIDYIAASDIYLSTSLSEGLPYSLLEASMFGLPMIVSDVRGNNEVIVNDTNGFLFELDNISLAAEKILYLKNEKEKYQTLSYNARKIFLDKFAEQKMIIKLKEVYENIIL